LLLLPSHLSFLYPFVKLPPAENSSTISKSVKVTMVGEATAALEVIDSTVTLTATWMLPLLTPHLLMLLLPAENSSMILRSVKVTMVGEATAALEVIDSTVTPTATWMLPLLTPHLLMLLLPVVNSWTTSRFVTVVYCHPPAARSNSTSTPSRKRRRLSRAQTAPWSRSTRPFSVKTMLSHAPTVN
jgi:hypothetical protein